MAKRIGLLTAGGDAPGQNVCLKAIIYGANDRGYEVVGIRKGWEGLLRLDPDNPGTHADNAMVLTKTRTHDIDRTAGSFLHSSRVDPGCVSPQSAPLFLRPAHATNRPLDLTDHIKRVVEKLQLQVLILLGDNSSLNYAARLNREGVPVIGIPKSVENDVSGSHYCLGFSTALANGVRRIHEIRAMAGSREEIAVVELFGRTYGLTTMLAAALADADRVLVPEVPFDPERLATLLAEDKRMTPSNYAILAMSEAVRIEPAQAHKYDAELQRRANARQPARADRHIGPSSPEENAFTIFGERAIGVGAGGGGAVVTEILENLMGERMLFQPLSYLLRVGEPDGQDLLGAMNFATMAVELLASGKTGRMVAYRERDNYVDLPLETVTQPEGKLDVRDCYNAALYRATPGVFWAARV
jgi:ATP-dependent phosphofructokinase / diphosphate-dependent phosphofructokinase